MESKEITHRAESFCKKHQVNSCPDRCRVDQASYAFAVSREVAAVRLNQLGLLGQRRG